MNSNVIAAKSCYYIRNNQHLPVLSCYFKVVCHINIVPRSLYFVYKSNNSNGHLRIFPEWNVNSQ